MNKRLKKGFTLTEVLVVVALMGVISALSYISFAKYKTSMSVLDLDANAKTVFVAAQNNLSRVKAQKYLGAEYFGTEETQGSGIMYLILPEDNSGANTNNIIDLILPSNTVDETVLSDCSYIIRYDKNSGKILDVFSVQKNGNNAYAFSTDDYSALMNDDSGYKSSASARENYLGKGIVLGYYGGTSLVSSTVQTALNTPSIAVNNGNTLSVTVGINNNDSDLEVFLDIEGLQSGKTKKISLYSANGSISVPSSVSYVIDDITSSEGHFSDKFGADGFIPGENLKIKATVSTNNSVKKTSASSAVYTVNSLFGSLKSSGSNSTVAAISNFRHLENISKNISSVDLSKIEISSFELSTDLDWSAWKTSAVYRADGTPCDIGYFASVNPCGTINFNGNSHRISNLVVTPDAIDVNAGLFSSLIGGSVSDLEIIDAKVISTASGAYSGALAGKSISTSVKGIFVHNSGTNASSYVIKGLSGAGGLIGCQVGGSIDACSASVYVRAEQGNAGGLCGKVSSSAIIKNSYCGAHTTGGTYSGDVNNVNVYGKYAGTLVGSSSKELTIENCYSTASARYSESSGHAYGLVGDDNKKSITNSYSAGRCYDNSGSVISAETVTQVTEKASAVPYDNAVLTASKGFYSYRTVKMLNDSAGSTSLTASDYTKYPYLSIHYGDFVAESSRKITYNLNEYKTVTIGSYTKTYEVDNSSNPAVYNDGETVTIYPVKMDNFEFLGWIGSNGSTPQKTVTIAAGDTGDKLYTATWAAYRLSLYDGETLYGSYPVNPWTSKINDTDGNNYTDPVKTGYTFAGWDNNKKLNSGTIMLSPGGIANKQLSGLTDKKSNCIIFDMHTNAAVYAKWQPKTYTVTFDNNNGTGSVASVTVQYNSAVLSPSSFTHPARTGKVFAGWTLTRDGNDVLITSAGALVSNISGYTDSDKKWIKDDNVTVYGKWIGITHSLTLEGVNFRSYWGSNLHDHTRSFSVESGSASLTGYTVPKPYNIYLAGWDYFYGWYTEEGDNGGSGGVRILNPLGNIVVNDCSGYITDGLWDLDSDKDKTLYAHCGDTPMHTITLYYGLNNTLSCNYIVNGDTADLSAYISGISCPYKNATLDGWYTGKAGSGTKILNADGSVAGSSLTVSGYVSSGNWNLSADITLYACWSTDCKVKLMMAANQYGNYIPVTLGKTASLADSSYTQPVSSQDGWVFEGWYTEKDGSVKLFNPDGSLCNSGATVNGYLSSGEWVCENDVYLYGKWTQNQTLSNAFVEVSTLESGSKYIFTNLSGNFLLESAGKDNTAVAAKEPQSSVNHAVLYSSPQASSPLNQSGTDYFTGTFDSNVIWEYSGNRLKSGNYYLKEVYGSLQTSPYTSGNTTWTFGTQNNVTGLYYTKKTWGTYYTYMVNYNNSNSTFNITDSSSLSSSNSIRAFKQMTVYTIGESSFEDKR